MRHLQHSLGWQGRGGPIRLDSARGLDKWILCG